MSEHRFPNPPGMPENTYKETDKHHKTDQGGYPYVTDITELAVDNCAFRSAIWTGCHLQMTLMSIPPCSDIGLEIHENTDQLIRIEKGNAIVKMGKCKCNLDFQKEVCESEAIFIPAGYWHNIINKDHTPLKLSSVYSPSHHPKGTYQRNKPD